MHRLTTTKKIVPYKITGTKKTRRVDLPVRITLYIFVNILTARMANRIFLNVTSNSGIVIAVIVVVVPAFFVEVLARKLF
jgi:hypothetical protein